MEYSRYNFSITYGKHRIIYNMISGYAISDAEIEYKELNRIREHGNDSLPISKESRLLKGRFVVTSNEEEIHNALSIRHEKLMSKECFRLEVNTTFDCNFSCSYCQQSHRTETNINGKVVAKVLKLIKQKHESTHFKVLWLSLFGGEPLYNRSGVEDIVNRVKEQAVSLGYELQLFITTNGSLLSNWVIDLLRGVNVTLQITFDGKKERHNKTRPFKNGMPTYDIILRNTKRILDELPMANICVRSNYDETISPTDYYEIIALIRNYDRRRIYVCLTKIFQLDESLIPKQNVLAVVALFNRYGFWVRGESLYSGRSCPFTYWNAMFVDYNGDLKLCSQEQLKPYDPSLDDLRSEEKYLSYIDNLPKECEECLFVTRCKGMCIKALRKGNWQCENVLPDNTKLVLFIKQELIRMTNERK